VKPFARILFVLAVSSLIAAPAFAADAKPTAKPAAEPPDSLAILEKAVARDSTKFDNLYRLGVLYLDRERMVEAERVFAKAHQIRPKDVKVLVNLGASQDQRGHSKDAQANYRKALEIAPGDSVASCRLASSLYTTGGQSEAIDILRDVIAKKPRSHCAYFTLGVAFADAGIYRDAIRMWKKVVELAPGSPEAVSAKESIDVLEKFVGTVQ
jgi:Flp pilus assembly protein TadD